MIKKILIAISILFVLTYGGYLQYLNINKSGELNSLIKQKLLLENNYIKIEKETSSINNQINDIKTQKASIEKDITDKGAELSRVNAEINKIIADINKQREAQAKENIANGSGSKVAYLTFDDGPSQYTNRILDILNEYGVKATFFVNGRSDGYSYDLYRRIVNEGHTIGNHMYSHNYKTCYSSVDSFDNNFNNLQTLLTNITGVTPSIMRFPGGSNNTVSNSYNNGIMDILTIRYLSLGYQYFDWNVSAGDSAPSSVVNNTYVINNILNGVKNKTFAIILMHDPRTTTQATLETIITSLSNSGFKFSPLTSSTRFIHFK